MPSLIEKQSARDDLTLTLVALLRADAHLCNVLTHISSSNWSVVEQAIAAILDRRTAVSDLSRVARNMIELLCDDAGPSGRIMRPFFFRAIARIAGAEEMERLESNVARLRLRMAKGDRARPVRSRPRRASAPHIHAT